MGLPSLSDASNRIPIRLDEAITTLIRSEDSTRFPISQDDITLVVNALEQNGKSLCGRLNTRSFVVVFAVLRVAEPCLALQRGLCLLSVKQIR